MKTNWLIIILLTAIVGFTQFEKEEKVQSQIQLKKVKGLIGEKNSSVFIYQVQLRSTELLKQIEIIPSISGVNTDSHFSYNFENPSHQAVINYFYVIPKGIKHKDKVTIKFILTDEKTSKFVKDEIVIDSESKAIQYASLVY